MKMYRDLFASVEIDGKKNVPKGTWVWMVFLTTVFIQLVGVGLTVLFGTLVGLGGIIWSFVYWRTKSLLAPWISHALVDGALFYIGFLIIR